uniref:Uncharacterized protein n=1 Tax=Arundo donax TaxID=35708 RepID=A0A0A9FRX7_ARUDO
MDHSELSEPNSPVCLISPCIGSASNTVREEDDVSAMPCSEINNTNIVNCNGGSSLSSALEPSFLSSEQEFVSTDDVQSIKHGQSTITFQSGDDKFTVQELLSSAPEVSPRISSAPEVSPRISLALEVDTSIPSAPEVVPSVPTTKGTLLEEPDSAQSWKKHVVSHLNPPVDDMIQIIRHSTVRVSNEQPKSEGVQKEAQNMDIIKHLNVVREDVDVRSSASNTVPSRLPSITARLVDSEADIASKILVASDVVKLSSATSDASNRIETSPGKEALDVTSFRQRAEALEGLLELSAELLENHRLEELAIVLKPFGKDKVSPREIAIWLARSFKGMMSNEAGRMSL